MNKYYVLLEQTITRHAVVEVDAENIDSAADKADYVSVNEVVWHQIEDASVNPITARAAAKVGGLGAYTSDREDRILRLLLDIRSTTSNH